MEWGILAFILSILALLLYLFFRVPGISGAPDFSGSGAPSRVLNWTRQAWQAANKYDVPLAVLLAQIWTESDPPGNPDSVGSAGEIGLMQVKEIAYQDVLQNGGDDWEKWRTDPLHNIMIGAQYLALNMKPKRANGDIETALKMYNQGPTGYLKNQIKAQNYADKVLNRARLFNGRFEKQV